MSKPDFGTFIWHGVVNLSSAYSLTCDLLSRSIGHTLLAAQLDAHQFRRVGTKVFNV